MKRVERDGKEWKGWKDMDKSGEGGEEWRGWRGVEKAGEK